MAVTVFNRCEKKYLLPEAVYRQLREELSSRMQVNSYGLQTICNIYYDTPEKELIRRSVEKPVYKEKLRLRSYGIPGPDSTVYLEIKKKYQKIVNKRRAALTLQQAYDYVERGIHPGQDSQILREIDYFLQRRPLERSVYLAYDRIALFETEHPDFRVTFDSRIRSRETDMGLEQGDAGTLLLPENCYLMESKIMGAAPLWFSRILAGLQIYPVSFSKYGNVYKTHFDAFHPEQLLQHLYREESCFGRKNIC